MMSNNRKKKNNGISSFGLLIDGVANGDWINTGYIHPGYTGGLNTSMEIVCKGYDEELKVNGSRTNTLTSAYNGFAVNITDNTFGWIMRTTSTSDSTYVESPSPLSEWRKIYVFNGSDLYIDDVLVSSALTGYTPTNRTWRLGGSCNRYDSGWDFRSKIAVKYIKFWSHTSESNRTLVVHLVAQADGSFYDEVSETYFYNQDLAENTYPLEVVT